MSDDGFANEGSPCPSRSASAPVGKSARVRELVARVENGISDGDREDALKALDELKKIAVPAGHLLFIAEHLFEMVPQSVWRDSGGDDGQGHYEGDYHAEAVRTVLAEVRSLLEGSADAR